MADDRSESRPSEPLQSEDDRGGGVTLTPEDASGHTLPESESGAEPQGGRRGGATPIMPPD